MADFPGTLGADSYAGTADADTISDGGGGADSLAGAAGNDVISVTGGSHDTVDGGADPDRLVLTLTAATSSSGLTLASVTGSLAIGYSGLFDGTGSSNTSFSNIEHFTVNYSGVGAVNIVLGDGDDVVSSGGGADNLRTGGGVDVVDGGAGLDRWGADLSTATADIVIDLGTSSTYLTAGSVVNVEGFSTLATGAGDDQLTGTAGNTLIDVVDAGGGDDVITLFSLDDDTVAGGAGGDRLVLITSESSSTTSFSGTLANGYTGFYDGAGANNFTFSGIEHFTYIYTGASANSFRTGDGDDVLTGGSAGDTIRSGGGVDQIDGGAGNDFWGADLSSATANIVIDLATSSTFLTTGSVVNVEAFNTLLTGSGNDTLSGSAVDNLIDAVNAGGGDDLVTLFSLDGDTVAGGSGSDRLVVVTSESSATSGFSGDLATGYSGLYDGVSSNNLSFSGIEHFTYIYTGASANTFVTGDGDDVLTGGSGNDIFSSGAGIDQINGGGGVDVWGADMSSAVQDIVIDLNATSSTFLETGSVAGIEGLRTLLTGSGNDRITGTSAGVSDTLNTGGGDDVVTLFGLGEDDVVAGIGEDTLVIRFTSGVDTGVTLTGFAGSLAAGYSGLFDGTGSNNVQFSGVENFDVSYTGLDNLVATVGDGIDRLTGGAFNDALNGGGGDDTLEGGAGNDTLTGGLGADVASYASAAAGVTVALIAGAQITGGTGTDTLAGFEALTGSAFNDRLTGDGGANTLTGGDGSDALLGGVGDDRLDGGAGVDTANYSDVAAAVTVDLSLAGAQDTGGAGVDTLIDIESVVGSRSGDTLGGSGGDNTLRGGGGRDQLTGGAGRDSLFGDARTDTLTGGLGQDDLYGGAAGDRFIFTDIADSTVAQSGRDRIRDWNAADGDLINLRAIDANETTGGNNAFTIVAALTGAAGELWLDYDGTRTVIRGDVDGGGADFAIEVESAVQLVAADFLL